MERVMIKPLRNGYNTAPSPRLIPSDELMQVSLQSAPRVPAEPICEDFPMRRGEGGDRRTSPLFFSAYVGSVVKMES